MNDTDKDLRDIQERVSEFLTPLCARKVIDKVAFENLENCVRCFARKIKGSELVPRSVLNEIKVTIGVLRAEAHCLGAEASITIDMANRLEMILDLILRGESPDDRIPGVPRII
ncbi:hypothetical protein THUN1379_06690 [Paludibacterium sp. THUN1379]|uniref:hypothetical protein n=1 Tax=Paludibacterium sp. THUN1379 TaxID=3112107 RepID=UPI003088B942|nr:hypothetical protein THUN1379_06690 [Paludibacterium sp. THUN1379]